MSATYSNPGFTSDRIHSYDHFLLKRQVLALTGKVRIYTPDQQLLLYSEQKMFKLKEDIRVFADEQKQQELLWIQARQVIDFAAAYDVMDSQQGMKLGTLRRKGWRSMVRDAWEVLDVNDQILGTIGEDNMTRALLRRLLLGSLLPQRYELQIGERPVAHFNQRFHLFRYEMDILLSEPEALSLDRRVVLAAAILLAVIEGKQS